MKKTLLSCSILALVLTITTHAAEIWWMYDPEKKECIDTTKPEKMHFSPALIEKAFKCKRVYKDGDTEKSVMVLLCTVKGTPQSLMYGKNLFYCNRMKDSYEKMNKKGDVPTRIH